MAGNGGRPEVQAFYGALAGRKVRKVILTTSTFSRDAIEFAKQVGESIVLVDGVRLAGLMIRHGVGVDRRRAIPLPQVDETYLRREPRSGDSESRSPRPSWRYPENQR